MQISTAYVLQVIQKELLHRERSPKELFYLITEIEKLTDKFKPDPYDKRIKVCE